MVDFRAKALSNRKPELLASFPADQLAKDVQNVWHLTARRIYRNWLSYIETQRTGRLRPRLFGAGATSYPTTGFDS